MDFRPLVLQTTKYILISLDGRSVSVAHWTNTCRYNTFWCGTSMNVFNISYISLSKSRLQYYALFLLGMTVVAISLEMMGKFALTITYTIVYMYTTELYPTVLRNTALGVCSMAARIGGIIAPYFAYLSKDVLKYVNAPSLLMTCEYLQLTQSC